MSSAENPDKAPEEVKPEEPAKAPAASLNPYSAKYSLFGGGGEKEKKIEERGEVSGSAKAQRDAIAAAKEGEDEVPESEDLHFEPVVHLTEKVETVTNEEEEEEMFRGSGLLYRLDSKANAWKERGKGIVRVLKHPETGKTRVVMRREQTLVVCANHYILEHMDLRVSVSGDKSRVWRSNADVSDGKPAPMTFALTLNSIPEAETFAIEFNKVANPTKAQGLIDARKEALNAAEKLRAEAAEADALAAEKTAE